MKFTIVLYLESPVLAVSQCHKTSGSRFRRANNFGEEEWRAEGVVVTSRCVCMRRRGEKSWRHGLMGWFDNGRDKMG